MKTKATLYSITLNIFLISFAGGFGYFIWRQADGLPWYWKVGFVFGAFGLGILLMVLGEGGLAHRSLRLLPAPCFRCSPEARLLSQAG